MNRGPRPCRRTGLRDEVPPSAQSAVQGPRRRLYPNQYNSNYPWTVLYTGTIGWDDQCANDASSAECVGVFD
jgi:hypothetical protein